MSLAGGASGSSTAEEPGTSMGVSGKTTVRVRYPETDQMGIVHHSNYLVWFEVGRTELMRQIGTPYSDLEKAGIYMPVVEAAAAYHSPAHCDEVLQIESEVTEATRVKVSFSYRVTRLDDGRLLATGKTIHVATDGDGRPKRMPPEITAFLVPSREQS
jgi:acyl-CoA thioester hydrolase